MSRNGFIRAEEEKEVDLGDSNYDEFAGYSGSLFQSGAFDKEDDDADKIYDMVEARMDSRRKKARHQQDDPSKSREDQPNLQKQFVDLKRELLSVSEDQWMQLPTAHERLKAKKVQKESISNIPDSMLLGAPPGMPSSSITEVGEAKRAILSVTLDKDSSGLGINAEEYLNELSDKSSKTFSDIGEVKKARLLFKSVTKADPTNPTGWIAAARLEESTGNPDDAKAIIARALSHCGSCEELWLMAVRHEQNREKRKAIVANGIRKIPKSVGLWQEAAEQEEKQENKIRVLQKSLEIIPSAVSLWKSLINLTMSSDRSQVLLLLERAVECCPDSEEMWLTFAKLSDFSKAQKILNDARKAIPTSVSVWVSAAELAEAMSASETSIQAILLKGMDSLAKNGVTLDKSKWLETAVNSEKRSGNFNNLIVPTALTGIAVKKYIDAQLVAGTEPKAIKRALLKDHEEFVKSSPLVAESILSTAVHETVLKERKGLWRKYLEYLVISGDLKKVEREFSLAVSTCPHAEVLWLTYAKFLWANLGDAGKARKVLESAMHAITDSEDIYIAAARIEESFSVDSTRQILATGRSHCPRASRLWIKAAQLERARGDVECTISICQEGVEQVGKKNSDLFKLFIIPCHVLLEARRVEEAFGFAAKAVDACPLKAPVWAVAADIAVAQQDFNKARSVLERARVRLPSDELLWWKGFLVEELCHGKGSSSAKVFLSRALQACPGSGVLWACAVETEPVATRHPKCLDALKRCPNDPLVVCAVAKFFWIEKLQIDKARKWFLNALQMGKEYGQVWADIISFEMSLGDENAYNLQSVLDQFSASVVDERSVCKGFLWNQFRKQVVCWNQSVRTNIMEFAKIRYPEIFSKPSSNISSLIDLFVVPVKAPPPIKEEQ